MEEKIESLPESFLTKLGFHECECKDFLSPEGKCFEPQEGTGEGYCWFYEKPNMFAIDIIDLVPNDDYTIEFKQPDFISVDYFDEISAEELAPFKKRNANCIRGHVSNSELFAAQCHKGMPMRGVEIILMPGYYNDYLKKTYPSEFPDPKGAFQSVNGMTDFPELVLLIKQIKNFNGKGMAAHLYYESKIAETLSLIIEKTRETREKAQKNLNSKDLKNIENVKQYIDENYAIENSAQTLCKIACMGQTKMRESFKKQYCLTISEYTQKVRIEKAKNLLTSKDMGISQIAKAVGYNNAGRFSALFKKQTGVYPEEYKNMIN